MRALPDEPIWDRPTDLLALSRPRTNWCTIDGILPSTNSPGHHQLLVAASGRWLFKQRNWVLDEIRRHLDLDSFEWGFQLDFLAEFMGAFLHQYRDLSVTVQVLPRRRTFRTHFDGPRPSRGRRRSGQLLAAPEYGFRGEYIGEARLKLSYGLAISGRGLWMGAKPPAGDGREELWWTKIVATRWLGAECSSESWYCLATERDGNRIVCQASVPALEPYFDPTNQEQTAPLVSLCAISPRGERLQTHCVSLSPGIGRVLDIRQSRPSLRYHCQAAPHNHRGLKKLVWGNDD